MKLQICTLLLFLSLKALSSPPPKVAIPKSVGEDGEPILPKELTSDTFDLVVGEQLSFVEFYSPYCHHCKELAPVWEKAFVTTAEDQKRLGIQMRQVNCVESGDLCERENVNYYPNLRLYSPLKKDGKSYGKHIDTFPRTLSKTVENFKKYMVNSVAEFDTGKNGIPSSLQQIDIDLGLKIVAGEAEDPYFIALFSSTNEEYDSTFSESCLDCVEHRQNWERLSNLVVTASKTGHLNCHTHPILCKKLGFPELSNGSKYLPPRYIMFVPKSAGRIRFDYPNEEFIDISKMKSFVTKLSLNYKYEEVTTNDLQDLGVITPELPENFKGVDFPLENKMALVFSYDKRTATPEDKSIMPYLLEMVTQLPFNIDLYASSSDKLDKVVEKESMSLIDYVNKDETFAKRTFDRKMFLSTSLTLQPTLYILKSNSLIPVVFQNFALEDMRMPEKLKKFVTKNAKPFFGELTPSNLKYYFNKRNAADEDDKADRVAITFIDSENDSHLEEILYDLSIVAHQYHLEKNEYFYAQLLKERGVKEADVAKLKEKNADSVEIIQRMRTLIPHMFHRSDVAFTYIDLKHFPKLADMCGFNIDGKKYVAGDTIVVSLTLQLYWDQDLAGNQLKSTPKEFREVLKHLLDPKLLAEKKHKKFVSKLVGSPYPSYFRALDIIHQRGFFAYILTFMVLYVVLVFVKRASRVRPSSYARKDGIIGAGYSKAD